MLGSPNPAKTPVFYGMVATCLLNLGYIFHNVVSESAEMSWIVFGITLLLIAGAVVANWPRRPMRSFTIDL
ncbi:MAG TPA: hypothetical protein VJY39_15230 [Acidisphaera sp.]|nr:hypothetical protein [Acidisphaera sp.]